MRCFILFIVFCVCECYERDRWFNREYGDIDSIINYKYSKKDQGVSIYGVNDKDENQKVNDNKLLENIQDDKQFEMRSDDQKRDNYDEMLYDDRQYNDKNDGKTYAVSFYGYSDANRYSDKDDEQTMYNNMNNEKRRYNDIEYSEIEYGNRRSNDYDRFYSDQDRCNQQYEGEKEEIIRPCALNDWECIRRFMATNSDCKPAYAPIPDPLYIPVDKFFIPVANLTITHTDLRVTGFGSANIKEFHLNKETGNLVIAVNVKNVNQTSPKSFFTYQRTAKEPIVLSDFTTVLYNSITFTAVIPYYPHLRLDKAEIHADIADSTPTYKVGPGISNSTDPDVVSAITQFKLNISTVVQEAYVFQSFLLTGIYIQRSICDFGVDVYGNYLRFLKTKGFVVSHKQENIKININSDNWNKDY